MVFAVALSAWSLAVFGTRGLVSSMRGGHGLCFLCAAMWPYAVIAMMLSAVAFPGVVSRTLALWEQLRWHLCGVQVASWSWASAAMASLWDVAVGGGHGTLPLSAAWATLIPRDAPPGFSALYLVCCGRGSAHIQRFLHGAQGSRPGARPLHVYA